MLGGFINTTNDLCEVTDPKRIRKATERAVVAVPALGNVLMSIRDGREALVPSRTLICAVERYVLSWDA